MVTLGTSGKTHLRVGVWSVDPTTNQLDHAGTTVRMEPKVMELLVALARRPGQVVSREDLLASVWPGVVVGDDALTQSVIKLRKALGDKSRSPAYIETISKRGYRLIAAVVEHDRAEEPFTGAASASPDTAPLQRRVSQSPIRMVLIAVVAFAAIAAAAVYFEAGRPAGTATAVTSDTSTVGDADKPAFLTVTVLPFETVGAGAEQDYLARGISTDLMTDLSRLSGLRVLRASIGPHGRPAAPAARYVVSGSVQRDGANLRINVHLIDSRTSEQLWSHRFERPYGDLFAIQNEIGSSLTEQLPGTITEAERRRLAKRYTHSLEAYDYFLRAQALFLVRRSDENARARSLYAKALELDPKFARAYAGLAMTYAMDYRYRRSAETAAALTRALELVESARMIDPDLPDVHWALGFVHAQSRRHDKAIASLHQAIVLNPSYADAYALLGGIYTYIGEPAKTVAELRSALRLNPDGGYLYYLLLGRAYVFENDIEQALINLREARSRNPDDVETRIYLAAALVARGDVSGAEWEMEEVRSHEPQFSLRSWLDTYPMTSAPQRERLTQLLGRVTM